MPSWLVGSRDVETATEFLQDLAGRLANPRVQLTSDGLKAYPEAVRNVFGRNVDYAVLDKQYEGRRGGRSGLYSGCLKIIVSGSPNLDRISTSFVERANLTIRQNNRRYTRKSTGFSKRLRGKPYRAGRRHNVQRVLQRSSQGVAVPYHYRGRTGTETRTSTETGGTSETR